MSLRTFVFLDGRNSFYANARPSRLLPPEPDRVSLETDPDPDPDLARDSGSCPYAPTRVTDGVTVRGGSARRVGRYSGWHALAASSTRRAAR